MRVRYHGPRTVKSVAAFYSDVSGIDPSMDSTIEEKQCSDKNELKMDSEQENCPFWLARTPQNILKQDTYLALAASFVILRPVYPSKQGNLHDGPRNATAWASKSLASVSIGEPSTS
uniref:Uncharacterized protein n=1 Tax=Leersia perrieri TaxID=77586 RepID=A0A0D9WND4_9ORYZ